MFLTTPATAHRASAPNTHQAPAIARRAIGWLWQRLDHGSLTLTLPNGRIHHHAGRHPGPHGQIAIHRWALLARVLWRGDLGFAESHAAGEWSSPDLTRLIALAAANLKALDQAMDGALPARLLRRIGHALRSNSLAGSRRNIAFHYDLGNEFYRLWLDDSMSYSSALALPGGQSLEQAQATRLAHIADLLAPEERDAVLEIGCGWGALAAHLASRCGRFTGITLSHEQLAFARDRISREGLDHKVELRLQDYREVDGTYDRLVSIEMLEAVGEQWWPTYFQTIHDRLAPDGRAVLQVITIAENRFEHYRRSPDFIQRYIFPGGMLPTRQILRDQAEAAGLRMTHSQTFGHGYAQTLAEWHRRFNAHEPAISAMGYDARFRRLWRYYLAYCEAGFLTGQIDVGLYVLEKHA